LCDERFATKNNQDQLSSWLRPHIRVYSKFGESTMMLTQFFKNADKNRQHQTSNPNPIHIPNPNPNPNPNPTQLRPIKTQPENVTVGDSNVNNLVSKPANLSRNSGSLLNYLNKANEGAFSNGCPPNMPIPQKPGNAQGTKLSEKLMGSAVGPQISLKTSRTKVLNNFSNLGQNPKQQQQQQSGNSIKDTQKLGPLVDQNKHPDPHAAQNLQKTVVDAQRESKKDDAKEYLSKVRKLLTAEEYSQFQSLLRGFKSGNVDLDSLVSQVRTLFSHPTNSSLRAGFISFIPKKHQQKYSPLLLESAPVVDKIKDDSNMNTMVGSTSSSTSEATLSSKNITPSKRVDYDLVTGQPLRPSKKPKLNPGAVASDTKQHPKYHIADPDIPDPEANDNHEEMVVTCAICHSKAVSPFSAKCGHICCHACWQQWLYEKLECPVCREKTRVKQLTKLYFL
jgi:hypothetical protein